MNFSGSLHVYIYDVVIAPDCIMDQHLTTTLVRKIKQSLEMMLGKFVVSGRNLFTTIKLESPLEIKTSYKQTDYTVFIDSSTFKYFKADSFNGLKMEEHSVIHSLVNIILKDAFRETHLRQIGKTPRFFDPTKALEIAGSNIQMWPGYRASAFNYNIGLACVIDNVVKFMSTKSCLERIYEI